MDKMNFSAILPVLWILFADYILVLGAIMADLWSGVRKARIRGEARTSYGYKKTVEKVTRYYNALLALTIVDCMHMASILYLNAFYGYHVPVFPAITVIGSIGMGMIEIKSIYEKAEDKVKYEYQQIGLLAAKVAQHKADPEQIAKAVIQYMNKELKNGKR